MKQSRWVTVLVLCAACLAGCASLSCNEPPKHGSAASIPPLRVPVGLESPDTRNALKVPELNEPERPQSETETCLDAPPSFFPNLPSGELPASAPKQSGTP